MLISQGIGTDEKRMKVTKYEKKKKCCAKVLNWSKEVASFMQKLFHSFSSHTDLCLLFEIIAFFDNPHFPNKILKHKVFLKSFKL